MRLFELTCQSCSSDRNDSILRHDQTHFMTPTHAIFLSVCPTGSMTKCTIDRSNLSHGHSTVFHTVIKPQENEKAPMPSCHRGLNILPIAVNTETKETSPPRHTAGASESPEGVPIPCVGERMKYPIGSLPGVIRHNDCDGELSKQRFQLPQSRGQLSKAREPLKVGGR